MFLKLFYGIGLFVKCPSERFLRVGTLSTHDFVCLWLVLIFFAASGATSENDQDLPCGEHFQGTAGGIVDFAFRLEVL